MSETYQGLKKAKRLARQQRNTNSLPKYIRDNVNTVQFGISTLPSDNMTMVMNNGYGHDFLRKLKERKSVEHDFVKMTSSYLKNMKYNVYMTKAQAMRDQVTRDFLDKTHQEDMQNAILERFHIPKL